jgi:flagellar assembly protein FliH
MSSRARRVHPAAGPVTAFPWGGAGAPRAGDAYQDPLPNHDAHLAALEREAFGKGFAQGELAGAEAAAQRGEAMLHHLVRTIDELTTVRGDVLWQTERQMVQLALAIARRVVHREVALDPDLLLDMARTAIDRLGGSGRVTIRLHPDDHAAVSAARASELAGGSIAITADARLSRGACHVESDIGLIDAGLDAQLDEFERALLGLDVAVDGNGLAPAEQPVHV